MPVMVDFIQNLCQLSLILETKFCKSLNNLQHFLTILYCAIAPCENMALLHNNIHSCEIIQSFDVNRCYCTLYKFKAFRNCIIEALNDAIKGANGFMKPNKCYDLFISYREKEITGI